MNLKSKKLNKDIILFVGSVSRNVVNDVQKSIKKYKIGLIYDINDKNIKIHKELDVVIPCSMNSPENIKKSISLYYNQVVALACRSDKNVLYLEKIIPYFPKLNNPTVDSLTIATNKIQMRRKFLAYDKSISPEFMVVTNTKKQTLKKIKDKIGFPLVSKPSSLASSLLVNICFYSEELENTLKYTFKKLKKIYTDFGYKGKQEVLVEQFMDGNMYAVDAYIDKNKKIYFCPFTNTKTGMSIGFDDFFEYQMITPTNLNQESISNAKEVATKAIRAINLFNSSAHIELLKTEKGWKIIEIGARVGGSRQEVYALSYGINHTVNDVLNKIGKKPIILEKVLSHTAILQFFPKKEGVLKKILGLEKIQNLKSLNRIRVDKKPKEKCLFSKNGGIPILHIILSNKNRSDLLGDIRRIEQTISFEII
jgi:biotin carboxylase